MDSTQIIALVVSLVVLAAGVFWACWMRFTPSRSDVRFDSPYELAILSGGERAVREVAALGLIFRRHVVVDAQGFLGRAAPESLQEGPPELDVFEHALFARLAAAPPCSVPFRDAPGTSLPVKPAVEHRYSDLVLSDLPEIPPDVLIELRRRAQRRGLASSAWMMKAVTSVAAAAAAVPVVLLPHGILRWIVAATLCLPIAFIWRTGPLTPSGNAAVNAARAGQDDRWEEQPLVRQGLEALRWAVARRRRLGLLLGNRIPSAAR